MLWYDGADTVTDDAPSFPGIGRQEITTVPTSSAARPARSAAAGGDSTARIRSSVREQYDRYPFPGTLNAYGPWTEIAPTLLTSLGLSPEALRGARVLDAGCGTGEYARSLAHLGANVTALDLSEGALETARRIDREQGLPEIDYRQADLLALPDDLGEFDYVFSLGVLHHTADPRRGFHSLVSHVRRGGHLTVGLYSSVSRAHILGARALLRAAAGGDQDRAIDLGQRWLRPALRSLIGAQNVDDRARVADLVANVHERPIGLATALRWFRADGFEIVGCAPTCDLDDYPALARWLPPAARGSERAACLAIQLRWLLWSADYSILAGRASAW